MRKIWFLGFLGFLTIRGIIGLYQHDWWQALWLIWVIWFAYFLPKKIIVEKIVKPLIVETAETRTATRKSEGRVTNWRA